LNPESEPYEQAPAAPVYDPSQDKSAVKRPGFRAKLMASRAFFISVIVHVVFVLAASALIVQQIQMKRKETFNPGPPAGAPTGKATEHKVAVAKMQKRSSGAPPSSKRIATTGLSSIALPDMPTVAMSDGISKSMTAGMGGTGMGMGMGGAAGSMSLGAGGMANIKIPPAMQSRCSVAQRMATLKESGATKCDAAVRKALAYLKTVQNQDGSFGKEFPMSMTGLCILAYLGHCETPDSPEFGSVVSRATMYLLETAGKTEAPTGALMSPGANVQQSSYENAIVTYALCEMYTMTKATGAAKRLPKLETTFKKGVKVIIDGQIPKTKGWDYAYRKGNPDMSVSGWNFQALRSATYTGEQITGLDRAIKDAIDYMKYAQSPEGGFSYNVVDDLQKTGKPVSRTTLAGVGTLAFEMMHLGDTPEGRKARDYLAEIKIGKGNLQPYDWYYTHQAFFMQGGDPWKKWNAFAMDKIMAAQAEDGSFSKAPGGSGPQEPGTLNIYKTALCTLMLEVYYRYLPTTQKNLGAGSKPAAAR